jgi:hypothetical protein
MKNKITETDWENVIDAEIDINLACSNFTKTFLKRYEEDYQENFCSHLPNR